MKETLSDRTNNSDKKQSKNIIRITEDNVKHVISFDKFLLSVFFEIYNNIIHDIEFGNKNLNEHNFRRWLFWVLKKYYNEHKNSNEMKEIMRHFDLCEKLNKQINLYEKSYYKEHEKLKVCKIIDEILSEEYKLPISDKIHTELYHPYFISKNVQNEYLNQPFFFWRPSNRNMLWDPLKDDKLNRILQYYKVWPCSENYKRATAFQNILNEYKIWIKENVKNIFMKDEKLIKYIKKIGVSSKNNSQINLWHIIIKPEEKSKRDISLLGENICIQEISSVDDLEKKVAKVLKEVYQSTPYNSLDLFLEIIKEKEQNKKGWDESIKNAINNGIYEWDICTWMSQTICEKLKKLNIKAYNIRFKAVNTVNDDCSWDWHVWAMVWYKEKNVDNKSESIDKPENINMIWIDPWLVIPKPVHFVQIKSGHYPSNPKMVWDAEKLYYFFTKNIDSYSWQIVRFNRIKKFSVLIEKWNINIKCENWEFCIKDEITWHNNIVDENWIVIMTICKNSDHMEYEFPYLIYTNKWKENEKKYYIKDWVVAENTWFNVLLDIDRPLTNPETIKKDYLNVAKNLRFCRFDSSWQVVAKLDIPIRWGGEIKLREWKKQVDWIMENWWLKICKKNGEYKYFISDLSDKKQIDTLKLIFKNESKLKSISDMLKYNNQSLIKDDEIPDVDEIYDNDDIETQQKSWRYFYRLIYALLQVSKNYQSFIDNVWVKYNYK